MTLVTLENVTRRFGEFPVLEGLSLRVDEGDRIGVVGDNGAGKTTMVRILAGTDDADLGQRNCRRNLRIAFGQQMPRMPEGTTVRQFVMLGTGEHGALEQRMRELETAMAAGDERALAEYGTLQAAFESGGGYDRVHRVEKVLGGLGFDPGDLGKDVSVLSGGERSRVQLAVLMTTPADLLILDEPTNHLDLQGIEFVEDFVQRYPGAVLVVSHDRDFLDRAVTSIVEVADGVANRFKGNFTHYAQQRDAALLALTRAHKNQREFVEKEMDFIRRNMAGQKSAQAKGRLKRLQRLQLIEKPRGSRAQMRLKFGGGKGLAGQTVVEADNLVVLAGGQKRVLDGAEFRIQYGEVVALLGRNGAGKTTLLRLIAGQGAPAAGTIRRAQTMRIGYFSQEKNDLPASGTVLDALRELDRTVDEKQLRDHLALFLFCGDDVEKPVADLSGGEKQRLSLARMTRSTFDLLCLDEPTNHLDVAGTEGLEQALKEYPGTVVIVTHDRRLVREVADRVLWLEEQKARSHPSLDACIDALHAEASRVRAEQVAAREREEKKAAATAPPPPKAADSGKIRNPLMFQRLEERIFTLEAKLKELRESMLAPENYGSGARMKDLQGQEKALEQELQDAYAQWENWQ